MLLIVSAVPEFGCLVVSWKFRLPVTDVDPDSDQDPSLLGRRGRTSHLGPKVRTESLNDRLSGICSMKWEDSGPKRTC